MRSSRSFGWYIVAVSSGKSANGGEIGRTDVNESADSAELRQTDAAHGKQYPNSSYPRAPYRLDRLGVIHTYQFTPPTSRAKGLRSGKKMILQVGQIYALPVTWAERSSARPSSKTRPQCGQYRGCGSGLPLTLWVLIRFSFWWREMGLRKELGEEKELANTAGGT